MNHIDMSKWIEKGLKMELERLTLYSLSNTRLKMETISRANMITLQLSVCCGGGFYNEILSSLPH